MTGEDEQAGSGPISGPGGATQGGPGNVGGTGTGTGSGPTGGRGPSVAGGPGGPGGDEVPSAGPSVDDVPDEATEADQEAVDLGSELSFPASDPPAYMGAGAITGPPIRDEKRPEEPVISEGGDPHDATAGPSPSDDPTGTG